MNTLYILKIGKWLLRIMQVGAILAPLVYVLFTNIGTLKNESNSNFHIANIALIPTNNELTHLSPDISISAKANEHLKPALKVQNTTLAIHPKALTTFSWAFLGSIAFISSLWLLGLELLIRIIKTTQESTPFTRMNIRKIYSLALILLAIPLAESLLYSLRDMWIIHNFDFAGLSLQPTSVSYMPWLIASIILLAIGKVMDYGIALQEEQALTI